MDDLQMMYPHVRLREDEAVWDALRKIYEYCDRERFIFIFDEWDFIYHQDFASDEEKQAFTKFLSNLLKDKAYVEMAYMTGILPITRYSSGSEFNMFFEFSMATMAKYSEYFDFTDEEVDVLHQKYIECQTEPKVTRAGRELWYDGYQTASGRRLYNTHFVVGALSFNQIWIVELKVDGTVDSAIQQIKDRRYAQSFHGKLGEEPKCTGRILAVGIAYNRKDPGKRHTCKVEVLRERMA